MKFLISNFKLQIIWFLVMLLFPSNVMAATLSLSPSSGTFNRGCNFSLDVVVDTQGAQTDGTDAILFSDPSRFSISTSKITPNTSVYPDFPGNNVDETTGKITVSGLASVATPFTGKGSLATLNFTVKDAAPTGVTQITFDFDPNNKANTRDSNVVERVTIADVLNSVVNGSYTIGTGSCGTQTVTPTPRGRGGPDVATPSASPKTIDCAVDKTCNGPGTPQVTFTLAILGSVLTVLGILGLALL